MGRFLRNVGTVSVGRSISTTTSSIAGRWGRSHDPGKEEETMNERLARYAEAYRMMAEIAKYRPAAPGDGFGHVSLSAEQLEDEALLNAEAARYAARFMAEEDADSFCIGCANFDTNQAFIFIIEAARLLCGGNDGNPVAVKLLRLAINEIELASKS